MYLSQNIRSHENTQNTIDLLRLLMLSENNIDKGRVISQEQMFKGLEVR